MPLHLIKLSVGTDSVQDLEDWIKLKLKEKRRRGEKRPERIHTTRMVPKRAEQLLDGGSIYWVIRGEILCRERILAVRPIVDREGVAIRTGHHCAQPVMDRFGVPATARASFAMYNTFEEIDALVAALGRVRALLG